MHVRNTFTLYDLDTDVSIYIYTHIKHTPTHTYTQTCTYYFIDILGLNSAICMSYYIAPTKF